MKSRRTNPIYSYFEASVRSQIDCEQKNVFKENRCESYSQMSNKLLFLAKTYQENEERIKVNQTLVNESYQECLDFRDHSMERVICSWADMFYYRNRKLGEEQIKIEVEAKAMIFTPS